MAGRQRGRLRPVVDNDKALSQWADSLSDNMLLCRDIGHQWRPHNARFLDEMSVWERSLRCARCRTERLQLLSARGHVLSNRYEYPDGYQTPRGSGRVDSDMRDELRLASVTNFARKDTAS